MPLINVAVKCQNSEFENKIDFEIDSEEIKEYEPYPDGCRLFLNDGCQINIHNRLESSVGKDAFPSLRFLISGINHKRSKANKMGYKG